jgi:hypothetical protein
MTQNSGPSLVKPDLDTQFHIDYLWWQQNDNEWKVYLRGMLDDELKQKLSLAGEDNNFDWVDSETGEVRQVAALQYFLAIKFSKESQDTQASSMIEAIFRELLKNSNAPLSTIQLAEKLDRPAKTILKTLSGVRVYRGIRPFMRTPK